ncbi:MAG: PhoH family protein [Terrimicrobiaceae bacterium]
MHRPSPLELSEEPGLLFEPGNPPGRKPALVKNFVVDTNVLLHDPHCVNRFANNHVFIPVEVLSELDRFKNEQTERGAAARTVHRFLTGIFSHDTRAVTRGAATAGGGTVRVLVDEPTKRSAASPALKRFEKVFPDDTRMDHRILRACLALREKSDSPTILVTKDLNMQLKAMAIGLTCQDYLNDKATVQDAEGYEIRCLAVEAYELQRFGSSRTLELPPARVAGIELNEYVLLTTPEKKSMPGRHMGGGHFVRLNIPHSLQMPGGIELHAANAGQQCFLDALLDPEISLVTCYGQAGTGKTLMAVAAGLYLTAHKDFSGMTVSRPVVAMGATLGYLPGTLNEKMHPWLQSIYDAFEVLIPLNPPRHEAKNRNASERKKPQPPATDPATHAVVKPYERLIERGLLEIEALCYIRGRSIPNRFFVLDEAQQLTPLEAKTIVTRMSKGSKLVMVGDPGQIDNPYVDSRSNGLVYTRNRLRGKPVTAHICLTKGERSELAELGASLM